MFLSTVSWAAILEMQEWAFLSWTFCQEVRKSMTAKFMIYSHCFAVPSSSAPWFGEDSCDPKGLSLTE